MSHQYGPHSIDSAVHCTSHLQAIYHSTDIINVDINDVHSVICMFACPQSVDVWRPKRMGHNHMDLTRTFPVE